MKVVIEFSEKAVEQFDVNNGLENIDCESSAKDVIRELGVAFLTESIKKNDLNINLDDFKDAADDERYRMIVSDLFITLGYIKAVTVKGEEEAKDENKE